MTIQAQPTEDDTTAGIHSRVPVELGTHTALDQSLALLMTDLEGFTPLVEQLGDRRAQRLIHEHNRLLRNLLAQHRGAEVFHTGDGILAGFRRAHDAVRCAIAMQLALAERNAAAPGPALRVRIGIHQGRVLVEEDRLFGVAVVAAVRICNSCVPGRVLVSQTIYAGVPKLQDSFASRGLHLLKGFAERVELFELARP